MSFLKPEIAEAQQVEATPLYLSGFEVFLPPAANLSYEVVGHDSQIVQLQVPPGEIIVSEPGTMCHMTSGFDRLIDSKSGCMRCLCAGESCFRVRYVNNTTEPLSLGLTPNFPAKVIPIDLAKYSGITISSGAFMGAVSSDIDFAYRRAASCGIACCAGQGLVLSSITGTGTVFLNGSGTVMIKELKDGEVLFADSASVLAFQKGVGFDIRRNKGCLLCCCGGEGLYNTVLTGPGLVILQSMPFGKLVATVHRQAAQ